MQIINNTANKRDPMTVGAVFQMAHAAIHDGKSSITVNGKEHPVIMASNNCRKIEFNYWTVIEQNKNKLSEYAKRAETGERISWAIPKLETGETNSKWVLITDEGVQF